MQTDIGRKKELLGLAIKEMNYTIKMSKKLNPQWRAILHRNVYKACLELGDYEKANLELRKIEYYQQRSKRSDSK